MLRATLPIEAGEVGAVNLALALNQREASLNTCAHFLGSWCPCLHGGVTFVSFLPNRLQVDGLLTGLVFSLGQRLREITEVEFDYKWSEHLSECRQKKIATLGG